MSWLSALRREGPSVRTAALGVGQARIVAALHQQGGFARSWDPAECAALLADAAVFADAAFVERNVRPAGFVISRLAADEAEILTVVLVPAWRGRGLGRPLLGAHLGRLAAAGAERVFLEVDEGNAPALRLYARQGFVEVGRRNGYYPKPDGSRATALTMRLDLG